MMNQMLSVKTKCKVRHIDKKFLFSTPDYEIRQFIIMIYILQKPNNADIHCQKKLNGKMHGVIVILNSLTCFSNRKHAVTSVTV